MDHRTLEELILDGMRCVLSAGDMSEVLSWVSYIGGIGWCVGVAIVILSRIIKAS